MTADISGVPEWPDVEAVVCDYLSGFGHVCTWYPDPSVFESLLPIIMVQRTGGGSPDRVLDVALVTVAVTAGSRSDSWATMGKVRRAIRAAHAGFEHPGAVVVECAEQVGPQQIPQLNPDHREVQMSFQITTRANR